MSEPEAAPTPAEPRALPWREALAVVVFLGCAVALVAIYRAGRTHPGATVGAAPPSVAEIKTWFNRPADAPWSRDDRIDFAPLRGKVVVLEFWSAWCGECAKANVELNDLHAQGRADLQVIGVTKRDHIVDEPAIVAHIRERIRFPVALLGRGRAITTYRVQQIPHSVILGRDGTIRWQGKGGTPGFRKALEAELARSG